MASTSCPVGRHMAKAFAHFRCLPARISIVDVTRAGSQVRSYARNPIERRSYEELLKSMSSGRGGRGGKGRKKGGRKDFTSKEPLYMGQGTKGLRWPGLSLPLPKPKYGENWMRSKDLGPRTISDAEWKWENAAVDRELPGEKRSARPLSEKNWGKKGWSGKIWGGRHVGCPELPNGEPLINFESIIIELRRVSNQTKGGKKSSLRALVVVGNGDGAAGYATGKGQDAKTAIRKAKNRAVMRLQFLPRCEQHTIYHSLSSKFCRTNILMERKVKGFGLQCHRAVSAVCKLVGISDLRAKILGSTNLLNVVQATFKALQSQETHSDLAEGSGRHVVEMRREMGYRPVVVASPISSSEATKETARELGMAAHHEQISMDSTT